jgi:hypothetical protein
MQVTALRSGREVTGLRVGAANVRRYFPKQVAAIELELDHLRIECGLTPDFWQGEAEIRDPRLCVWLKAKHFHAKPSRPQPSFAMVPSGENCFKIEPNAA